MIRENAITLSKFRHLSWFTGYYFFNTFNNLRIFIMVTNYSIFLIEERKTDYYILTGIIFSLKSKKRNYVLIDNKSD